MPWLIVGDFNLFRAVEDTTTEIRNLGTMLEFNNFIDESGLLEVPLSGRSYTWSNNRPNPTFSKLDMALLSHHWNTLGETCELRDLPATASDHAPLLLRIKQHTNPLKRKFKFELFWLKYQDIKEVVAMAWGSVTGDNMITTIQRKIAKVRQKLRVWAQEKFKKRESYLSFSKEILQQLDHVEERRILNSIEFRLRIRLKEHIRQLAADQEEKWKQRSGITWLKLGNKNTRFFHAVANARKNNNAIVSLPLDENMDSTPVTSHPLPQFLHNHFRRIMGSRAPLSRPFDLSDKIGGCFAQELQSLDDPITEDEIRKTLQDMPRGKASGLDGFPIEFY